MEGRLAVASWFGLEEHRPAVETWLSGCCADRNEVEDVVQETFLRAARYRGSLQREERLKSWLVSIAHNVLTDRRRGEARLRRVRDSEAALQLLVCEASGVDDEVDDLPLRLGSWRVERDRALGELGGVLAELRASDRELLHAYYAGAGGCRAVADSHGVRPDLVKVRLFRARRRLMRAMHRRLSMDLGRHDLGDPIR